MKEQSERLEDANRRLTNEIEVLKRRLNAAEQHSSSISESKMQDDMSSQGKVRRLERELEEAKEENERRVADTPQFQQMRRMMQSQSQKLRDLRRRLEKYEPDAVKEDDD